MNKVTKLTKCRRLVLYIWYSFQKICICFLFVFYYFQSHLISLVRLQRAVMVGQRGQGVIFPLPTGFIPMTVAQPC